MYKYFHPLKRKRKNKLFIIIIITIIYKYTKQIYKTNIQNNFKAIKVTFTPYGQSYPDYNFKPKYSYTYKGIPGGFYV